MTAADTMGPFLYLSIRHSLSPPSHLSSCPPSIHPHPQHPPGFFFFSSSPCLVFIQAAFLISIVAGQGAHLLLSAHAKKQQKRSGRRKRKRSNRRVRQPIRKKLQLAAPRLLHHFCFIIRQERRKKMGNEKMSKEMRG